MSEPGAIILDTNVYRVLRTSRAQARLRRYLEESSLQVWPSALNALEAAATADQWVRADTLTTIREVAGTQVLLPMPGQLLKRVGEAIIRGENSFRTGESGL